MSIHKIINYYTQHHKTCIVYYIHKYNDNIKKHICKIYDETKNNYDLYVLYNVHENNDNNIDNFNLNKNIQVIKYKLSDIIHYTPYYTMNDIDLNIPSYGKHQYAKNIGGDNITGVILFWFYYMNSNYDYYWTIEGDCYYNGNYGELFNTFKYVNDDLLGPNYYRFGDVAATFYNGYEACCFYKFNLPDNYLIYYKMHIGFIRLSNKAFDTLIQMTSKGYYAHTEMFFPTTCVFEHLIVNDLNIYGDFYIIGSQDENHSIYGDNIIQNSKYGSINVCIKNFYENDLELECYKNKILHKMMTLD